jgi:hypothetical protein
MQKYDFIHYTHEFGKFFFSIAHLNRYNVDTPDDKRNDPTIFDGCTGVLKHIVGFLDRGSFRRVFNC